MTRPPPPPFTLSPPPDDERDRTWVKPHWRFKNGRWVKVDGYWRISK